MKTITAHEKIKIHRLGMDKKTGRAFTEVIKTDITVAEDKEFRGVIKAGENYPKSQYKGDKGYFKKLANWRSKKAKRKQTQKISRITRMLNFLKGK